MTFLWVGNSQISLATPLTTKNETYCPPGEESWCKFKLDKLKGTKTYKPHVNIPYWKHQVIKPIFMELSSDELLGKCLHGQTQNPNEALNQKIWNKIPKEVFVGRKVLEIGINSAIIEYNDGSAGIFDVLEYFGIRSRGLLREKGTLNRNTKRIKSSAKNDQRKL